MSTETLNQPKTEHEASREHLSKEEVNRIFAELAFMLAVDSAIEDDDPIWAEIAALEEPQQEQQKSKFTFDKTYHRSAAADMFDLLNYAYSPRRLNLNRITIGDVGGKPHTNEHISLFGRRVNPQFDDNPYLDELNILRAYSPMPYSPAPKSEFTPAPSMAAKPLGPELPNLAFNDRVRPTTSRPGEADFAAADRANEMYQRALFDKGWRGGEATPEQAKSAGRALQREYHPDLPTTSEGDKEAVKAFNAQNAKPVTPAEKGPAPTAHS